MTKAFSYIRFSTPEQLKGDSLRRQTELSEKYAKEHDLVLDDSIKLQDLGLSAYSGAHLGKGALGAFLKLVEEGKIKSGSVLLVESLDRLSREKPLKAFRQFTDIIDKGIKIVTLTDNLEHTIEIVNKDPYRLFGSLSVMIRAHEESDTKAMRLAKAWENKRTLAINGKRKLTAKCPAWLKLDEGKTKFFTIPDRAKEIQNIFQMKLSGKGATAIVHELNVTEDIWKPTSRDKRKGCDGWRESYIKKILKNRAVIGEFQPYKMINGKRQPIGEPLLDYYPSIVDKNIFYRVQEQFKQNTHKGGKTGKVKNLFTHIAKCGYCGGPMAFIDKGPAPKGGQYLVCDRARRGLDCCNAHMKYNEFELLTLKYCKGLQPKDILINDNNIAITLLKDQLEGKTSEFKSITEEIKNLVDSVQRTKDKRVRILLDKRISEQLDNQESLKLQMDNLKQQVYKLSLSYENTQLSLDSLKELLNYLNTSETNKQVEIRLKLRNEIRKLIDSIIVYPVGRYRMTTEDAKNILNNMSSVISKDKNPKEYAICKDYLRQNIESPKDFRNFIINFKSGSSRTISPLNKMPLSRDFDKEKGSICTWHEFESGRIIRQEYLKDLIIITHYRRLIGQNNEEVLQEYFDDGCDFFNRLAEQNNKILLPYLNRI